jgi:hypothetical protein
VVARHKNPGLTPLIDFLKKGLELLDFVVTLGVIAQFGIRGIGSGTTAKIPTIDVGIYLWKQI